MTRAQGAQYTEVLEHYLANRELGPGDVDETVAKDAAAWLSEQYGKVSQQEVQGAAAILSKAEDAGHKAGARSKQLRGMATHGQTQARQGGVSAARSPAYNIPNREPDVVTALTG